MDDMKPPILDKDSALRRIGGDESLLKELVSIFMEDFPQQFGTLQEALSGQEFDVVRRQAHSLKSASASIGAERLREACAAVERQAEDPAGQPGLDTLSSVMQSEFQAFSEVVRQGQA